MTHNFPQLISSKKVFLWDFDGCVCDSENIHYEAYAQAFRHFGHEVNPKEYFTTFTHTGGGIAKEIENYKLSCPPGAIRALKDQYYSELIQACGHKIFPEIPAIVTKLRELGIKNVIASNSPKHEIQVILEQNSADGLFEMIVGLEPGLNKKPAPDIFLKALANCSVTPEEGLVIEDSERGLMAANAAGCQAIWIKTPCNEDLSTNVPHLAMLTHQELLNAIQSVGSTKRSV